MPTDPTQPTVTEARRRCLVTGNPCGTDTWPAEPGQGCACVECIAYRDERCEAAEAETVRWKQNYAGVAEAKSLTQKMLLDQGRALEAAEARVRELSAVERERDEARAEEARLTRLLRATETTVMQRTAEVAALRKAIAQPAYEARSPRGWRRKIVVDEKWFDDLRALAAMAPTGEEK